jgi:threonine dehydrogenase-like Zn-dependent dehydrogenase
MKAVVFHGIGDIRLEDVAEPRMQDPTDAIVKISASAICGTDLHMVRGTLSGMEPGRSPAAILAAALLLAERDAIAGRSQFEPVV